MKLLITFSLITFSFFGYSQKSENIYRVARLHYQNLEYEQALTKVNEAIEKSKKYYDAYLLRSDIYYSLDDTVKAFADLRKTIELFPTADRSYFLMGMIYLDHKQYDKAWTKFDKSTQMYKSDAEYFYYKGETALKLDNIKNACIAWNYGATKLEDEDCKDEFDGNCEGVDITIPEEEKPQRKSLKELFKK